MKTLLTLSVPEKNYFANTKNEEIFTYICKTDPSMKLTACSYFYMKFAMNK